MNRRVLLTRVGLLCGALLAASCLLPTGSATKPAPGTVTINLNAPARTVVADFSTQIAYYTVTLTSHDSPPLVATKTHVTGASVSFPNLTAGTYDVSLLAYNASNTQIGAGSLLNQTLTNGASPTWTVTVSGTQTGTGSFSFTFAFPTSTGVTAVNWQLYDSSNAQVVAPTGVSLSSSGANQSGTVGGSFHSGAYRLVLTFLRSTTIAGVFSEAVNIWDNVTSYQWLDPSGNLQPHRTFAATEFNSTNSSLANLTSSAGTWGVNAAGTWTTSSFSSGTLSYAVVTGAAVTFTPTQSLAGQSIQYTVSGTTTQALIPLASGAASVPVSPGSTVTFKVTASDGATQTTYTLAVGTQANVNWTPPTLTSNTVTINGPSTLYYGSVGNFTLTYPGTAASYAWYLDGAATPVSTSATYSPTPTPASFNWGNHTLTAVVTDTSGVSYSTTLVVTVTDPTIPSGAWLVAGSLTDSSGLGNNGTINGSVVSVPNANRFGTGPAYQFSLGGNIQLSGLPLSTGNGYQTPSAYTISFWMKPDSTSTAETIFAQVNSNGYYDCPSVTLDNVNRKIRADSAYPVYPLVGGVNYDPQTSGTTISDNVWTHVVVTKSSTGRKIYFDGVVVQQDSETPLYPTIPGVGDYLMTGYTYISFANSAINTAFIGGSYTGQSFLGFLDEVRIYSREISQDEVNSLYHEGGY